MNKRETVQALVDSVQQGDFEAVKSMLADDFRFSGPVPEPLNKESWLGMSSSLKTAFPDSEADKAISMFNAYTLHGNEIKVNMAKPR